MTDIPYSADNFEQIHLIGVRIRPDRPGVDLYALVLYNEVARSDRNRPLTSDGRIVFFRDARHARRALALGDPAFRKYVKPPDKIAYVYDLPTVIDPIGSSVEDSDGIVADTLNELFDFVAVTNFPFSGKFRDVLSRLADHTTFDKSLSAFFGKDDEDRRVAQAALLSCIGAVALSSLILD